MPFRDPKEAAEYRKLWKRADRAKKRKLASMTLAQRIAAGRALAKAVEDRRKAKAK